MSKYKAKRTEIDGKSFHSKREGQVYCQYKLLERAGEISHLQLQPKYPIVINGVKICDVFLDFQFRDKNGKLRVIDVKGFDTAMSKMKRKMVEAVYPGVKVEIVK